MAKMNLPGGTVEYTRDNAGNHRFVATLAPDLQGAIPGPDSQVFWSLGGATFWLWATNELIRGMRFRGVL